MYHAMRINVLKPLSSTIFPNIFYLKPSARTLLIQSFGIISNTVSITTSEHYLKQYQKRPNFTQYQNCMISGLFLLSQTVLILSVDQSETVSFQLIPRDRIRILFRVIMTALPRIDRKCHHAIVTMTDRRPGFDLP